jgi:hypothetical protein
MSDRYERTADWLRSYRHATDNWRLAAGIRVAQMDGRQHYGAGVIASLAIDANMHKSTLYEYAQVARFLVRWRGFSARQIFSDFAMLSYSHLRTAIRLEFEAAIDALLHAMETDPPMTPDQFSVFVAELRGKETSLPLFRQMGTDHEVLMNFRRNYHPSGRRIEVTVKEVK